MRFPIAAVKVIDYIILVSRAGAVMRAAGCKISQTLPLMALMHSASVLAAPLSFDCDVPPDRFSSVSENLTGSPAISGTVEVVQMRSGNNLPVAGARLVSADGINSVGLQLVAASAHAKQFDIVLNTKRGDNFQRNTVGQVDAGAAIPFSLSLSGTGKVALLIGTSSFITDFIPIPIGKAMAFCSTAQFKFTGLEFSTRSTENSVGQ
jgi:hypothetical protein